jgi:hypothetical protein
LSSYHYLRLDEIAPSFSTFFFAIAIFIRSSIVFGSVMFLLVMMESTSIELLYSHESIERLLVITRFHFGILTFNCIKFMISRVSLHCLHIFLTLETIILEVLFAILSFIPILISHLWEYLEASVDGMSFLLTRDIKLSLVFSSHFVLYVFSKTNRPWSILIRMGRSLTWSRSMFWKGFLFDGLEEMWSCSV